MDTTKEIADWLVNMESLAGSFYSRAAGFFETHGDNKELILLLKRLSLDESAHMNTIKKAASMLEETTVPHEVTLGEQTREWLKAICLEAAGMLDRGALTEEALIDCIIESEYSEWNDIFLFVLSLLKGLRHEYILAASGIQQHKKAIERYIGERPHLRDKLEKIKSLKDLWNEKILVVDDDDMIAELLMIMLSDEGHVDVARDGNEALGLLGNGYYALIVSDVDMPGLNGIDFFKKASAAYPNIRDRFLFFTGSADKGRMAFFRENSLRYILKPACVTDIKKAAAAILSKADLPGGH
ncbi:MAG: response regulator [Deltaproteobacteria bacterium]|nr:response regulator [Deltaproteobacteria bacterium]